VFHIKNYLQKPLSIPASLLGPGILLSTILLSIISGTGTMLLGLKIDAGFVLFGLRIIITSFINFILFSGIIYVVSKLSKSFNPTFKHVLKAMLSALWGPIILFQAIEIILTIAFPGWSLILFLGYGLFVVYYLLGIKFVTDFPHCLGLLPKTRFRIIAYLLAIIDTLVFGFVMRELLSNSIDIF